MAGLAGALERAIMELLWDADRPLRVREILGRFESAESKTPAYNTLQTVADRLTHKGLLSRVPDGNAFRYAPTCSRDDYVTRTMFDALAQSADHGPVLARFAETMAAEDARHLLTALQTRMNGDT